MAVKYTKIFHPQAFQNLSKLGFWFENIPSGNRAVEEEEENRFFFLVFVLQSRVDRNWIMSKLTF
jgi:hypothetical protein